MPKKFSRESIGFLYFFIDKVKKKDYNKYVIGRMEEG